MPYTYAKQGSKYTVYKKKKGGERGEKVGSTKGTKEALKKYLAALHANETTNENIMNLASKAERFFKPKDKNIKFKEDLQDLYYTNRPQYDKVKKYYMDQVNADRQSADIQAVMDAFEEIERGLNESVFEDIKVAGFKTWQYTDPSGEVFYGKGRDVGEAARYLRLKYKFKDIDISQIVNTEKGVGYIDDTVVSIYNRDYEPMDEMKNKLRNIVKELMADLPPIPTHKTTEVPAVAAMDQMMAQVNNMTLDQLYTLGKQISSNFPGFNPSFKGLSPEETEEKLRLEIKRFMDKNKSIVPKVFNFDGNTITLKAMQFKEERMNKKDLMEIIREVIAEEAGKVDVVLPGEGVIASVTPEQKDQLNGKGFTKKELKAFGIDHEAIRDDIRYKVSGDKSLQLTSILNYIPDNPYSHKKVTENKMKVNQLRQIIREEISKVLNEQTNRVGWDKGYSVGIEFNEELAQLLAPYLERGTISKDELEMAADQAGSQDYAEWDRIIGSKSEGPYTIKMFNGSIQISGTKGRDISKNMQSSFDKYGTNLGGK